MTSHHNTPEWQAVSKKMRARYKVEQAAGTLVCGRCGRQIAPGQQFDVGHIYDAAQAANAGWPASAINAESNIQAEHRGENRAAGGRLSQAMAHTTKTGVDLRHWQW